MANITQSADLKEEILNKNMWKLMVKLSIPAIIAMSVNGINAFVDALFVGQFIGESALAALSVAFPLIMITGGLSALVGVGTSSLLSIALGANDKEIQEKSFGTLVVLTVIISLVWGGIGYYFAPELIQFLGGEGEILTMGITYFRIMMLGVFFRIFAGAAIILIRAEGKIREAMSFSVTATLTNMVLNYLFLGVLDWGIEGVAWATISAMFLFSILNTWYYFSKKASYTVDLRYFKVEQKLLSPILKVGVPAMLLQVMFFVQQAVVFKSIAHYGDNADLAFMGASYRVVMLLVIPCFAFAQALQPVVGINYGAENYQRVRQSFVVFGLSATGFMLLLWTGIMIYPESVLRWMLPDAVFKHNDIFNFLAMMSVVPLMPLFFNTTTFYQSMGDGKTAGILLLSRELIVYVPFLLILPLYYGVSGIYYSAVPVNIFIFFVILILIKSTFKKLNA